MRSITRVLITLSLAFGGHVHTAEKATIGGTVELTASHPDGVPLHVLPESSFAGERVPDGALVTVVGTAKGGNWLRILLSDGEERWIVKRHVSRVFEDHVSLPTASAEAKVWHSPESCREVVGAGGRMPERGDGDLRVVSWNIRWFPDGEMSLNPENATKPQDITWLTCALAWLDADIVALQEIRRNDDAVNKLNLVLEGLEATVGGDWRADMQTCGNRSSQQVGFIWNAERVKLSGRKSLWKFNSKADSTDNACESNRRPGHYAYVEKAGAGTDFHMITIHLKSGSKDDHRKSRKKSLENIPGAVSEFLESDKDILILGDFNTMGAEDTPMTSNEEIAEMIELLRSQTPSWSHLAAESSCTEYYNGNAGWLDYGVLTSDMQKAYGTNARVTGYCSVASCEPLDKEDMPKAYNELSDHCPFVIDIGGREAD